MPTQSDTKRVSQSKKTARKKKPPASPGPIPRGYLAFLGILLGLAVVGALFVGTNFLQRNAAPAAASPLPTVTLLNSTPPCGDAAVDKDPPAPRIGRLAPDFTITEVDNSTRKLSDYRGKIVVLNFWASWCGPCKLEGPELEAFHQEYKDQDVVVLAVGWRDTPTELSKFANAHGFTFKVLADVSDGVGNQYGLTGVPTTFFIDKNGVIQEMQIGAMNKATMVAKLAKAR
jgi:cytochrome c biogenesis protein CcmG/thiol:disulfide interchange protein DsbE